MFDVRSLFPRACYILTQFSLPLKVHRCVNKIFFVIILHFDENSFLEYLLSNLRNLFITIGEQQYNNFFIQCDCHNEYHLYTSYYLSIAVSDAIRTSLGPRGMDKMVIFLLFFFFRTQLLNIVININLYPLITDSS